MARKFFIRTFGCQMNEHDSEQIAADLLADGLERAETQEDADVVVLNTCCIRENADNKLYGHLGHLKSLREKKPGLQIAVGGCLAQNDGDGLGARAPFVDAVFGTHNISHAKALLDQARRTGRSAIEILDAPNDGEAFPSALPIRPDLVHAAWVTVQVGCDNSCAFCIVPKVRGPEQSRPFGELVAEVSGLARKGTTEVTLLGQNVNSYGRDLTLQLRSASLSSFQVIRLVGARYERDGHARPRPLFADLLREVGAIEGIRRVRFTSPHPKDLRPETIEAMAETPEVCEQLHLPLQSGSDKVLRAMRRGYSADRYLARLAAARAAIPDLAVTTDLIVGFPGETDEDFEDTLCLVAEAGYDSAFTFIFSPRPGTRAAEMSDQFVDKEVIAERFSRLKAVVDRASARAHERRVGRVEEVVIEGVSKKDASETLGRTRQGKLVHFSSACDLGPGRYATVSVTAAGTHHLRGDLLRAEEPVRPDPTRVSRQIPVPLYSS